MRYDKRPYTLEEHLDQLISRGLIIEDREEAKHYLRFIGYYRLSGYMLPFQYNDHVAEHLFDLGTTFQEILNLYIFDRKLRLLILDAIERIEVAARAIVINVMSTTTDAHWYLDPQHFKPSFDHQSYLVDIKSRIGRETKSKDVFIEHYYSKYTNPDYPPSWMVFETITMGKLSKTFANLKTEHRRKIAEKFGIHHVVLTNWLHVICHIRNICAHHGRVWNRMFGVSPKRDKALEEHFINFKKFYPVAVVIQKLLTVIAPSTDWGHRLWELLEESYFINPETMGFIDDWEKAELWAIDGSQ